MAAASWLVPATTYVVASELLLLSCTEHPHEMRVSSGCASSGDLAFNIALGATLVALPLSIGAATRAAFVKYKFTDKRVSVSTTAPWESE
jgi:hypothetical protein